MDTEAGIGHGIRTALHSYKYLFLFAFQTLLSICIVREHLEEDRYTSVSDPKVSEFEDTSGSEFEVISLVD